MPVTPDPSFVPEFQLKVPRGDDTGTQAAISGINEATISEAISAGIYWFGVVPQGSTSDNTFRVLNISASQQSRTVNTVANLNQSRWCWQQNGVTGALPDPAVPVITNNANAPVLAVERS